MGTYQCCTAVEHRSSEQTQAAVRCGGSCSRTSDDNRPVGRCPAANPSTGHIRSSDHSEHPSPVSRYCCVTVSH